MLRLTRGIMGTALQSLMTEKEHEAWDHYVLQVSGAHYFQTYGWLKSYEPMGFTPHVLAHTVNGDIHGGVAFISAKLPLLPWKLIIIPHGPLPAHPDSDGWTCLMKKLNELCQEHRAIYAQIYPHELSGQSVLRSRLAEFGFTGPAMFTSHRFSSTPVTIDLVGKTEDDVISSFRKNTRYYIRRSLESRLVIRTEVDEEVFDQIYRLFCEHGKLMGYSPRPYRSLKIAWNSLAPKGGATFIQAWDGDALVGAILVLFVGRTAYYVAGAMRRESSKQYPAELMHWNAIRLAIKRQMIAYDLTSVGTGTGVAQFKAGFRPVCQSWHGARTKVYHPFMAHLLRSADKQFSALVRMLGRYRANRPVQPY
jgi:lipid II:glycine glycyltransferase (peptidoglycan interpeptide bridge formation enzyme)